MIAKFAHVSRWAERVKGAAMVGALAVAAASGYAFAISPTIDTDRTFAGSVNIVSSGGPDVFPVYTVPAGQQYTLTDVILTNTSQSTVVTAQILISPDDCSPSNRATRLNLIKVAPDSTLHIPLNTGLGFGPGKSICLSASVQAELTIRGYLSNAT